MKISKYIALVLMIVIVCTSVYYAGTYAYYYSFKGNERIKFITADTTSVKTLGDIFKAPMFAEKVVFATIFFYTGNTDHKQDLPYFMKLANKYKDKAFQMVYTNDESFDAFGAYSAVEQKKVIHQQGIFGYHVAVPKKLEGKMLIEKGDGSSVMPKYLLVKNGVIVDSSAGRPSNYEELCRKIDRLLAK